MGSLFTPTKRKKFTLVVLITLSALMLDVFPIVERLNLAIADGLSPTISPSTEIVIIELSENDFPKNDLQISYADFIARLQQYKPQIIGLDLSNLKEEEITSNVTDAALQSNEKGIPVVFGSQIDANIRYASDSNIVHANELPTSGFSDIGIVDEAARLVPLRYTDPATNSECLKSFSLAILTEYFKGSTKGGCYSTLYINNEPVPLENNNSLRINYITGDRTFKKVSYEDILSDSIPENILQNKILLVSINSSEVLSPVINPKNSRISSPIEIHANIINTILQSKFLLHTSHIVNSILILLITIIIFSVFEYRRILFAFGAIPIILIGYAGLYFGLLQNGIILNSTIHFAAVLLVLCTLSAIRYYELLHESIKVKAFFSRYVSSNVLNNVLNDDIEKLHIGGQKALMSVLFADIRGFTSLSEQISADRFIQMLNEYLTEMSDVIHSNSGSIDKFIGDCIMALWGVPIGNKNHAYLSVKAAVGMVNRLAKFNLQFKGRMQGFKIGVGINSGEMTIGNMGSSQRFEYTVIGDNVNLASRVEGLTKLYDVSILITESTYRVLKRTRHVYEPLVDSKEDLVALKKFLVRKIDLVQVKGKQQSVPIYQVYGKIRKTNDAFRKQLEIATVYEDALELYFKGSWISAKNKFDKILDRDKASEEIYSRMESLDFTPPKDWCGSWEMKTK